MGKKEKKMMNLVELLSLVLRNQIVIMEALCRTDTDLRSSERGELQTAIKITHKLVNRNKEE